MRVDVLVGEDEEADASPTGKQELLPGERVIVAADLASGEEGAGAEGSCPSPSMPSKYRQMKFLRSPSSCAVATWPATKTRIRTTTSRAMNGQLGIFRLIGTKGRG